MAGPQSISLPAGVRPGTNIVRVRAPGPVVSAGGQQIKVVGAAGQTHIIKSQTAGNMSGIAALAAAAAQQGKIGTSVSGAQLLTSGGPTPIKVVQGSQGQIIQQTGMRMVSTQPSTALIGGQTVRLASPSATVLKPGTAITGNN